jgi:hypothetical protein
MLVLLTGGIYDVRRTDGFMWHDNFTRFHEDWYRRSEVNRGNTQAHRQHGDIISPLLVFQNKERRLRGVIYG